MNCTRSGPAVICIQNVSGDVGSGDCAPSPDESNDPIRTKVISSKCSSSITFLGNAHAAVFDLVAES